MTSGSSDKRLTEDSGRDRGSFEQQMLGVLDRRVPLEALARLADALHPQLSGHSLRSTAIGVDANVFLRMSTHAKSADIIDYLSSAHTAPLIVPGQVIQEFWNNQLQAVDSIASSLRRRFDQLKLDVSRVDPAFGEFASEFESLLDRFSGEYGYVYDEVTVRRTQALLEALRVRARVPFVSRSTFSEVAVQRKRTKTPPGFRDESDGDFYVWVDLLLGLLEARSAGESFEKVAFISQDRKIDWVREGVAHPILAAEVRALLGVPFEIWSLQRLADEIMSAA